MVPVAALPRARTTVRSLTGNHGSRSGRRVQTGHQPDRGGHQGAVPGPGGPRQGRVPDQEGDRLASVLGGRQLRPEALERGGQLGLGGGRVEDAELAGDHGRLGDVLVTAGLVERPLAVDLVRQEEALHLGHVHPEQQVRVGGVVRRAVGHRPAHAVVDGPDDVDRLLGVVLGAERGDREEAAGAGEPAPHVAAVAGVLGHRGHRGRVHRLQQDGPDAADEHRGVAVDPGDGAVRGEPARTRGAVDPLAVLRPVRSGHAAEQLRAEPVAHLRHRRHGPRVRRPPGSTKGGPGWDRPSW